MLQDLEGTSFNAVVHAGGGWAGSDPGEDSFPVSLEVMWEANVKSAALAAHAAGALLRPGGMLTLTGAAAAMSETGTPGMAAYGMAKAATHHLMQTTSASLDCAGSRVNAILPLTIDTPSNRSAMPDADFSTWTSAGDIAAAIVGWAGGHSPPRNGSFVQMVTQNSRTSFEYDRDCTDI